MDPAEETCHSCKPWVVNPLQPEALEELANPIEQKHVPKRYNASTPQALSPERLLLSVLPAVSSWCRVFGGAGLLGVLKDHSDLT